MFIVFLFFTIFVVFIFIPVFNASTADLNQAPSSANMLYVMFEVLTLDSDELVKMFQCFLNFKYRKTFAKEIF